MATLQEWVCELVELYGLKLEDPKGICKLIEKMRIGDGRG